MSRGDPQGPAAQTGLIPRPVRHVSADSDKNPTRFTRLAARARAVNAFQMTFGPRPVTFPASIALAGVPGGRCEPVPKLELPDMKSVAACSLFLALTAAALADEPNPQTQPAATPAAKGSSDMF